MSGERQRPTSVRYLIVLMTFLVALLLYLDRFCISYTQRYLQEDLGLTSSQLDLVLSAFFIAYALAQVPSGWLTDRFGARSMLAIYIVFWSLFTALLGFTAGFVMTFVLRMAVGVSQAGAYPTAAALLRHWVPFSARGKANSFVAFGGRFGAFVAPLLTAYLVIAFVPVSTDSSLREGDLLDPHDFSYQLNRAHEHPAGDPLPAQQAAEIDVRKAIHARLPAAAVAVTERLSQEYQPAADQDDRHEENAGAPAEISQPGASSADRAALRDGINRMLAEEIPYKAGVLRRLKLEREAKHLAAQETRTDGQRLRLNRLVLESVFPESIRKVYVLGWRQVMFVYGSAGILLVAAYLVVFRDRPEDHPWCNQAERNLIAEGRQGVHTGKKTGKLPLGAFIKSRSLWLMCVNQFCGAMGYVFLLTLLPRYLDTAHSVPYLERSQMAAIPSAVGWIGMLAGGWATDRITARRGLRWRVAPIVGGRLAGASAFLLLLVMPSAATATAAFAVAALSNDFCNPAQWSYKQDVGGRYVGAVLGWANMFGNVGGAASPVLLGAIHRYYGWEWTFVTIAAAFLIAAAAALGVDARIPIDKQE